MIDRLKEIVEYAYENVSLYRRIYQERPFIRSIDDFKKLPYLTISDFAGCNIDDILSEDVEAISILPPIDNKSIFPFPRLESQYDRDKRYEAFYFIMEIAQIKSNSSFLILTDTAHSYFCGEIANNLLFYKYPTYMVVVRDHSAHEIRNWVDIIEPDCVILSYKNTLDLNVSCIFTINQYDCYISSTRHFDIYTINEIGWIGVRALNGEYVYPDQFYIEVDPKDNSIVITTLESELQPFIRYKTRDRGIMTADGRFKLTYIGEH